MACPAWAQARTAADVDEFAKQVGWPIVAKTPRGGYDGKGVRVVSSADELEDWLEHFRRFWTQRLDSLATELARGKRERRLLAEGAGGSKGDRRA